MGDILYSKDKSIHKARGFNSVLSVLWRTILHDQKIGPDHFNRLLDSFIRYQAPRLMPRSDKPSLKGNLMKEFAKTNMTWRSMQKAILLVRMRRFKITFEAEYIDKPGAIVKHEVSVDLSLLYDPNQQFEQIYEDDRIETKLADQVDQVEKRLNESLKGFLEQSDKDQQ